MAKPPEHLTVRGFLVVSATGEMRSVKQQPRLKLNEVAFPVTVQIPMTWGKVQDAQIILTMPDPPPAVVEIAGLANALTLATE